MDELSVHKRWVLIAIENHQKLGQEQIQFMFKFVTTWILRIYKNEINLKDLVQDNPNLKQEVNIREKTIFMQ